MICPTPFPHRVNWNFGRNRASMAGSGEIYFPSVLIYLKKSLAIDAWFAYLDLVNKSYFTQSEDGSFRPVTFNQSNLADIIADVIGHEFKSALADKVRGLIDDIDLTGKVRDAVDSVDIDDIATDAIRDEVTARIENMDISVDVNL
jgi:hypothetical protein